MPANDNKKPNAELKNIGSNKEALGKAQDKIGQLLGKINQLNLTRRVGKLITVRARIKSIHPERSKVVASCFQGHLWILALIFSWIIFNQLRNQFSYQKRHDKCFIELPSLAQKIFRPAENCNFCKDIDDIEKLSNVDSESFEERYAYSGRPVVIKDAMINWTAPRVFSFDFFKTLYNGVDANCQFFPYNTEFRGLSDVFNMSLERSLMGKGTEPWYVGWSNCDDEIGDVLRNHYERPYFLPSTAESEKTDWIFMGSHGYGAPIHVDDVEHPSWQAQIKGEKLWILEPPRECHYTCNRLKVIVRSGEIIVLDTNRWYHQTIIVSKTMSITIGAEYD